MVERKDGPRSQKPALNSNVMGSAQRLKLHRRESSEAQPLRPPRRSILQMSFVKYARLDPSRGNTFSRLRDRQHFPTLRPFSAIPI